MHFICYPVLGLLNTTKIFLKEAWQVDWTQRRTFQTLMIFQVDNWRKMHKGFICNRLLTKHVPWSISRGFSNQITFRPGESFRLTMPELPVQFRPSFLLPNKKRCHFFWKTLGTHLYKTESWYISTITKLEIVNSERNDQDTNIKIQHFKFIIHWRNKSSREISIDIL